MTKQDKQENKEEVLSVEVNDTIKPGEAIGNPSEKSSVLTRYVPWHTKLSREVVDEDIVRVVKEAAVMGELCHTQTGPYSGANAVSHAQIDNVDPLRFFVSSSGEIIINPVIVNHTKTPVESVEACTSFPERQPVTVQRFHKITVKFQQLTTDKTLSPAREEQFSGPEAKAVQHELEHMAGHTIYDENHNPEWCLGQPLLTATPAKE